MIYQICSITLHILVTQNISKFFIGPVRVVDWDEVSDIRIDESLQHPRVDIRESFSC